MLWKSIHLLANRRVSLFLNNVYMCVHVFVYKSHILYISSSIDKHLGCPAVVNKIAVNMGVWISLWYRLFISFGYILRRETFILFSKWLKQLTFLKGEQWPEAILHGKVWRTGSCGLLGWLLSCCSLLVPAWRNPRPQGCAMKACLGCCGLGPW